MERKRWVRGGCHIRTGQTSCPHTPAEYVGVSRPTAQRYLATLVQRDLVDLDLAYGATGRPEHRYSAHRP